MPATVLITGANGFIGSHYSKLMESIGHKVVPNDVAPRSLDLSLLGINAASHIINVADAAVFRPVCEKAKPTHIFHAALLFLDPPTPKKAGRQSSKAAGARRAAISARAIRNLKSLHRKQISPRRVGKEIQRVGRFETQTVHLKTLTVAGAKSC
jgi:nucleoside-diphosphate-sugar epimerase